MQYADSTKLRAYFFGNMYLSQIQQGIQAAHVVTKMFVTFHQSHTFESIALHRWGNDGVTKILLNGGYQSSLADVHAVFEIIAPRLGLPFAKFHEEEAALNGALTSVGIVVPEEVYNWPSFQQASDGWVEDWADPRTGIFSAMGKWPSANPGSPTPQEILAALGNFLPDKADTIRPGFSERFYMAMLYATLRSARLA